MIDPHRAFRGFERTFLANKHNNPQEPPDDRKNYDDMVRHARSEDIESFDEAELIATITYYPHKEEIKIRRFFD